MRCLWVGTHGGGEDGHLAASPGRHLAAHLADLALVTLLRRATWALIRIMDRDRVYEILHRRERVKAVIQAYWMRESNRKFMPSSRIPHQPQDSSYYTSA
jgi:hypothetical protein